MTASPEPTPSLDGINVLALAQSGGLIRNLAAAHGCC